MKLPMTPLQFEEAMEKAKEEGAEDGHDMMDDLMCNLLESLGYGAGVKKFKEFPKWYA